MNVASFKAYDVRGRVPDELNEDIAYAIGRAFAEKISPKHVVVGHDIRLSSPIIAKALMQGLRDSSVDVSFIGTCGTEEIYFATNHYGFDGGIIVTASHNPKDFNGMKMVLSGSRPVSKDSGLFDIRDLVKANQFGVPTREGHHRVLDHRVPYIKKLLSYVDVSCLKPLRVVANPGNGGAGPVMNELAEELPITLFPIHFEPDGNFPNGVPNPLLEHNRAPTVAAIKEHGADIGIAWDGDFDRCFLFDENGRFIEGYYIVGLLAEIFLERSKGEKIVHDPRLVWNTMDVVRSRGGEAIMSRAGHSYIKEKMREEDAIYGGEMSAHHYFRDFSYCDSGMIPWLLVIGLMAREQKTLSELVNERMQRYPVSGEINRRVENIPVIMSQVEKNYGPTALNVDKTDGLSFEYVDWRFNLRPSNTELLVRLNVETRGDEQLMREKTAELLNLVGGKLE